MSGLPADQEFVVIADPDGYYSRRVVITSLFEQQTMYVLSKNEAAVQNRFVLNDRSGQFRQRDAPADLPPDHQQHDREHDLQATRG